MRRQESSFGFYRTLLMPDQNDSRNDWGFKSLWDHGPDIDAFILGYRDASEVIATHRKILTENVLNSARRHPWSRYLTRSTEFYHICKRVAGLAMARGLKQDTVFDLIYDCFRYEIAMYSELNVFIKQEIHCIIAGDTPYFVINHFTGRISSKPESPISINIQSPISWFSERLDSCVRYNREGGYAELRKALTCASPVF